MQDVTGKVSLGHILYLLIFITVLGPHCHELWAPARLGNVCFPAKCLSLNEPHGELGLVQGTFMPVEEENVGTPDSSQFSTSSLL